MTKTLFRISMVVTLLLFVGVFVFAFDLDKYNVPPPDLRAPFKDLGQAPIVEGTPDAAKNPLSVQTYSSREVADLLTQILAETLSFDKGNFVYNSAEMEKYFTPEGFAQYQDFLKSTNFQDTLTAQDLQSGAYVEQAPLELSSGVYGGVYKWLFEVPVTISFIPKDAQTYRENATQPVNRRVLLHTQFTRVQDSDPNALKIEVWQILPPRKAD